MRRWILLPAVYLRTAGLFFVVVLCYLSPISPSGAREPTPLPNQVTNGTTDNAWDDRFGAPGVTCCAGFDRVFTARAVGNDVYVGGEFNEVASLEDTQGIARWDGRRWHALGAGLTRDGLYGGDVNQVAISGDNLYVVGNFDKAGNLPVTHIARWNIRSRTWHAVGTGDGPTNADGDAVVPHAVAAIGGLVYIGGSFTAIDGVPAEGIAVWNGSKWSPLAGGVADTNDGTPQVTTILPVGDLVYVGGAFDLAVNPAGVDDIDTNNIATWRPATGRWSALGAGTSATVHTLAASGASLYAGGDFTQAGGKLVNGIARWEGGQWYALGSGVSGSVYDLALSKGTLYVAGAFDDASGVANTNSLAAWVTGQWRSLRTDQLFNDPNAQYLNTVAVQASGAVFVGGEFNDSGQPLFRNVAVWNGTGWSGTGQGLTDGYVNAGDGFAVAVNNQGQAFVGGDFSELGGKPFRNLAMWDGSQWRSVGGGVDGSVSALLIRGDELYVGGGFTTVGNGLVALRVARWNMRTQQWSALGNGLPDGYVNDLEFVGTTLYAGGSGFPAQTECCLWKWNGTSWAPFSQRYRTEYFVAALARTSVYALASDGQRLFVGGGFLDMEIRNTTQRFAVNELFIYDPTSDTVSIFGDGSEERTGVDNGATSAYIAALAVANGSLYIGGQFKNITNVAAVNIARLDANGWHALGTGAVGDDATVNALTVYGPDLYVGGRFDVAGGQAFNIARWDTQRQQWSALGCGIVRYDDTLSANRVVGLAVQPFGRPGAGLYVVGGFVAAGCKPAESFAIWRNFGAWQLSVRAYLPLTRR